MPKRRRTYTRASNKRRRYNRRKKRYGRRKRTPLRIGGMPITFKAKLRYTDTYALNAAAGSIAVQNFRANSLFNPDQTGVGHQPYGYDQLSNWFNFATIIASKINIRLVPGASVSNRVPGMVGCQLNNLSTTTATNYASGGVSKILERPRSGKWVISSNYSTPALGANSNNRIVMGFSAKKTFPRVKVVNNPDYKHDTTGSPTYEQFYTVYQVSTDETADAGIQQMIITVKYITVFTMPLILTKS